MKVGPIDKRFAETARQAREASGLPQTRVAKLMTGYGFPWEQSTVWRAEAGSRVVSVGEAAALAVTLRFDIKLADLGADLGELCGACSDNPPKGFTCDTCGRSGS